MSTPSKIPVEVIGYEAGSLGLSVVVFIDQNGKKRTMLTQQFDKKYEKYEKK